MGALVLMQTAESVDLPTLVDRAAQALAEARDSAEVLEARDLAALAHDAAKRAARLHRAKDAHDTLIAAAHRPQAHALQIEAQAKHRLADEYDAAQARGEVATGGQEPFPARTVSRRRHRPPSVSRESRSTTRAHSATPSVPTHEPSATQ